MIIRKNKTFNKMSLYPNADWIGNADWVLNDNDPTDAEIEEKIISLYPNFEIVTDDDGNITDVVEIPISAESVIPAKKEELSKACEATIVAGVDVGDKHYSMTIEDQANILAWMAVAQTGKSIPYHSDGQPCRVYTAEEFMTVANAAVAFKTAQTTYCNLLMRQVEEMTDAKEVKAVEYGVTQLNEKYQAQYNVIMASLTDNNE